MFIVILIIFIVIIFLVLKKSKKSSFDSVVMVNGSVGSGKSLISVKLARNSINKAHAIWWRRKYIYSRIPLWRRRHLYTKFFVNMENFGTLDHLPDEEEPLLYSNIPIKSRFYTPLTNSIFRREARPHYKSVILIDESSLVATSLDYKDKDLSEDLQLFIKLCRHELLGCYRNIFGGYPNLIINTQSKNDNHYAFDRCINQVLYIFKSISIPFFKVVWVRDLLLIDSVVNEFDDDIKESLSIRWFLIPKKVFKMYNSFSYEFLTRDLPVVDQENNCNNISITKVEKFYIPTFHNWKEITNNNLSLKDIYIKFYKESEVLNDEN